MKRTIPVLLFLLFVLCPLFAQGTPTVGVMPFEARGAGVTASDAAGFTDRIIAEFNSWGSVNAARGSAGAEYIVRGTITRQGSNYILSGSTVNARNNQVLNEYRDEIPAGNISFFSFCAKAMEMIPFPNYLTGTWQASLNMPDGPVVCIIEFRTNRTVNVERYDTWEHRERNALRYEGYGAGTYTYIGYTNRSGGADAVFGVRLSLEETLPDQTNVDVSGLNIAFNADRSAFDILNGSLPCGRNYDGPSVHPSEYLGFTRFVKIR